MTGGQLACPDCPGMLAPWGFARPRGIRGIGPLRPRRARCAGCLVTHVLLPVTVLLRRADAAAGAALRILGESAAGRPFDGPLGPGEAVRIFTGAALPPGADFVVIQEEARRDGGVVVLRKGDDADAVSDAGAVEAAALFQERVM